MATVYLARDVRHHRPVALKVLSPELGAIVGLDRFLAEIRVTATLQHPNLLPLFDSGEVNGQPFYVMPYVDGESLRQRLDREAQLPVDEAIRIAVAVAGALEYAHAHGVIHRDLKPENILLQSGQPMVADFGIALAVSRAGGARVTQTGLSLGTPQYMSPEQAAGDKSVDGRTDIYSLAAVTYEMLTGESPHSGATIQAVIARALTERPRGVRTVRPSVPEYAAVAIERALEKLPADRWASPREFADALQGRTVALPPPNHLDASARPVASWRRAARESARDPVVIGALALAVIGAAFGAWASKRTVAEDSGIAVRFAIAPEAPGERIATASQIAISPDGRLITYVLTGELGYSRLVVREVGQLNARVIPGTDAALAPFFSPDGAWIGFVAADGRSLRKVPVGGGPIVMICAASNIQGAWWASPDTIIASVRDSLMIVSAMSGKLQPITGAMAQGERARRSPRVLDDGKTILYQSWRGTFAESKIGVTSLGTGRTQILDITGASPVAVVDGHLIYGSSTRALMAVPFDVSQGRVSGQAIPVIDQVEVTFNGLVRAAVSRSGSLIYASGAGVSQVVLADTLGHVRVLLPEPRNYGSPRVSPDGKRLAITISSSSGTQSDIWIYDIASATLSKLTSEGGRSFRPEWSPDGKRVIYGSNRDGRSALWQQNADLSGAPELVQTSNEDVTGGVVSPDGRAVVYWQATPGVRTSDLFYKALVGDTTSRPIAATSAGEGAPKFSPDGRWVAYTSNQDGPFQVYVQPFPPSGARYQVTDAGGMTPVWSRNGGRIFYVWNGRLHAATVRTSPTFAVLTRTAVLEGNYLLNIPPHANYDVSFDGQSFVLLRPVGQSNEIVVVHGWKYELRERASGKPGR